MKLDARSRPSTPIDEWSGPTRKENRESRASPVSVRRSTFTTDC